MGTILISTIVNSVLKTLNDDPATGETDGARYSHAEILGYINDCQKDMVFLKPDTYTENENVLLTAGVKQTVPGKGLVKVVRNMGSDGATEGSIIRFISDWDLFDLMNPDWASDDDGDEVDGYLFDERDPGHFYVTPPSTGYIEVVYYDIPTDSTTTITVDDIYVAPTIIPYCFYRAYAKDAADSIYAWERSETYREIYLSSLGKKDAAETINKPKRVRE